MKRLLKLIIFISERPRSDEQLKLEKQDVTNNCNSESRTWREEKEEQEMKEKRGNSKKQI